MIFRLLNFSIVKIEFNSNFQEFEEAELPVMPFSFEFGHCDDSTALIGERKTLSNKKTGEEFSVKAEEEFGTVEIKRGPKKNPSKKQEKLN